MGLSPEYIKRPAREETINDPTNNRHYWRFRMHVYLEDLLGDERLLTDLQVAISPSALATMTCTVRCGGCGSCARTTSHDRTVWVGDCELLEHRTVLQDLLLKSGRVAAEELPRQLTA